MTHYDKTFFEKVQPSWVWPDNQRTQVNQYVDFRHEFYVDKLQGNNQLLISADSNYVVWLNGVLLGTGQYHCFAGKKYYDLLPIDEHLKQGKNTLAVQVVWFGQSNFSYVKQEPGLFYIIKMGEMYYKSGMETKFRRTNGYRQGSMPTMSVQLPFTFEYDANNGDEWIQPDYVPDKQWKRISSSEMREFDAKGDLYLCPVKRLSIMPVVQTSIVAQGVFKRDADTSKTVAELMQTDYLSARPIAKIFKNIGANSAPISIREGVEIDVNNCDSNGIYLVLDMGRQECGYLDLDFEADSGTVVDVAFGQHLDDLRVRSWVGGRNFASRYICCHGRQNFTHYANRISGRYLQLHISQVRDKFKIFCAGLKPAEYPVKVKGEFCSPDRLKDKINDVAVRTLQLCMHEHYEDTPWREQAFYANDSRNQAICGYYCFGEYEFPKASFRLLAEGLKDDGYLEMCAPAEIAITIPSFTMTWFLAIADNLLYSGDSEFAKSVYPQAKKMLSKYIDSMIDGLLPSPKGGRFWNFYDWADGLDATVEVAKDVTEFCVLTKERFDAPLNMFLGLALKSMGFMATYCDDEDFSKLCRITLEKLQKASDRMFWDEEKHLYKTYVGEDSIIHFCELTQSLAILSGVSSHEVSGQLRNKLVSNKGQMVETTISQSFYKYEAILQDKEKHGEWCFNDIEANWAEMLYSGATSFWETKRGGWDFSNAGSLCHGWSAIPIYFYYAYLLGVRPIEPGFKKFLIDPVETVANQVSGKVPTPYGIIDIGWEKLKNNVDCNITYPKEIQFIVQAENIKVNSKVEQL